MAAGKGKLEMMTESAGLISCPHCGGAIKAAARVCKHCKRAVGDGATAPGPAPDPAPPTSPADGAGLQRDLRQFVVARGILPGSTFDELVAGHADTDAAVTLGRLAAAGHVTPMQIESLREGFRAQQDDHLGRIIAAGSRRGLLTPSQAASARSGFARAAFVQTPERYLVASGYLTDAQGASLRSAATLPLRAQLRSDPAVRRALLVGPAAIAVLSVGIAVVAAYVPDLSTGWAALYLVPTLGVLSVVWERSTSGARLGWVAATVVTGFVVSAASAMVWDHVRPRTPVAFRPNCTMTGRGDGECVFTNLGGESALGCGRVVVTCHTPSGSSDSRASPSFCSGDLGAGRTRTMGFYVAEFDLIRNWAVPPGSDWRGYCSFDWEAQ